MSARIEIERALAEIVQKDVDVRRNKPSTYPERQAFARAGLFLGSVKKFYGLDSIYYPACSGESVLESAFSPREILYLDIAIRRNEGTGNAVVGDMTRPPFSPGTFDSAYIQDLHLHEKGRPNTPEERLNSILDMVKPEGVVIYGKREACPIWVRELPFLQSQKALSEVHFPFGHERFTVFRKNG